MCLCVPQRPGERRGSADGAFAFPTPTTPATATTTAAAAAATVVISYNSNNNGKSSSSEDHGVVLNTNTPPDGVSGVSDVTLDDFGVDLSLLRYQTIEEMQFYGHKQPTVTKSLSDLVIYTRAVKFTRFASKPLARQGKGRVESGSGGATNGDAGDDADGAAATAAGGSAGQPVFAYELSSFNGE